MTTQDRTDPVIASVGTAHPPRGYSQQDLLDLFKVAINQGNGRAAVIYTDDTISKTSSGAPIPQVVLAQQR